MIPNTYFLYCPNHHKGHGKKSPCSITKASSEKWWIFVRAGSAKFYTLHPFFLFIFQALPNLRTEAKKKKKILKKKKVLVGAWCVHSWKNDVEPYGSCHCGQNWQHLSRNYNADFCIRQFLKKVLKSWEFVYQAWC